MSQHSTEHGISTELAGASVIVTRPAQQAAQIKRAVRAHGGIPLSLPGIGIAAVSGDAATDALRRAASGAADIVIFISPNAVRHAFVLQPQLRFQTHTTVCAIGAGTRAALQRRGLPGVVAPAVTQNTEGVLALPQLEDVVGRRIALITAPDGRDTLALTLVARGAALQEIAVYRRTLPRLTARHFKQISAARPPLFFMLSSAQALVNLRAILPAATFAHLCAGECIVSSLRLGVLARGAGFARTHISASASSADMLAATVSALSQHRL